jgi:hypothetical protein
MCTRVRDVFPQDASLLLPCAPTPSHPRTHLPTCGSVRCLPRATPGNHVQMVQELGMGSPACCRARCLSSVTVRLASLSLCPNMLPSLLYRCTPRAIVPLPKSTSSEHLSISECVCRKPNVRFSPWVGTLPEESIGGLGRPPNCAQAWATCPRPVVHPHCPRRADPPVF